MKAQVIRPFRYHLFALDVEDCSGRNRRKVHWSHPAEPGSLPITGTRPSRSTMPDSWSCRIPGTDPRRADHARHAADLQRGCDLLVLLHRASGQSDLQLPQGQQQGLYARNCVVDVGGRHFFVSDGDIYIYDGTSFNSIADEKVKLTFFAGVNPRTSTRPTACSMTGRPRCGCATPQRIAWTVIKPRFGTRPRIHGPGVRYQLPTAPPSL